MQFIDIVFYSFIVVVCIQTVFYLGIFSKFAFEKIKHKKAKTIPVSVIICAKNEAENLQNFLPSILEQDYPNFEVILINDSSRDHTLDVMEQFEKQYNNIKIVNVRNIEAFWANKKYALTLGIKAAKNNTLLFTDADCKPVSNKWISDMSSHFSHTKTIVIGYGAYKRIKGSFLNMLIRFETLLTATQYFSYASLGMPYMAVGRNLAYRSETFYDARGFMNHIDINSGDDDLFINEIATGKNTAICVTKTSFTESLPKTTFKDWVLQKRRHISTAHRYKLKHKILLSTFYASQFLFWGLAIALLLTTFNWPIVLSLVLFRFLLLYLILGKTSKKLNEKGLLAILPILELFLISMQMVIFIKNLISKPHHWK
ncbi:glycosyltransferase [Mangrovimonas cancribranchiae]|uniref:Glycosyltransferase n=1 Tax=Mangrovimonas cancribranchiae TaxID=3080055 RepID=A0AAU6P859_9FLAO